MGVGGSRAGVAGDGTDPKRWVGHRDGRTLGQGWAVMLWLMLLVPIVILVFTVSLQKFEAVMLGTDPWRDRRRYR
ncbi:hypothetical protein GCM10027445_30040 [Amycolatopsis endophytica]